MDPEKSFASDIKPLSAGNQGTPRKNLKIAPSRKKKKKEKSDIDSVAESRHREISPKLECGRRRRAVAAYRGEREERELYAPMYRYHWANLISMARAPSKLAALCAAAALSDFDIGINIPRRSHARVREDIRGYTRGRIARDTWKNIVRYTYT